MRSPVLITPPSILPVSLEEAKLHLRVDGNDEDALISGLLGAAVSHLDGWTGSLGRALAEQTWRADYDAFCRDMQIPLMPVTEIVSVTWRNQGGQIATVDSDDYLLKTDADGTSHIRFRNSYSLPTDLYESDPVSVTFKAGYPTTPAVEADPEADPPVEASPAVSTVPSAIKVAILLMVGHWFEHRETVSEGGLGEIPFAANALLSTYRKRR